MIIERTIGKSEMDYNQMVEIVANYKMEYPYKDLEIHSNEEEGTLSLWLDDCDVEIHIMEIYPTSQELHEIDEKGICGVKPHKNLNCPHGNGKYDWMFGRRVCDGCRKCFNFRG